MTNLHRILLPLCLALCAPSIVLGQNGSTTFTTSSCTAYGVTGTTINLTELTFGPDTILIGDRGSCTLQPPTAGCGTGTLADPYDPDCGAPSGIASFTSGTVYALVDGETNFNTNTLILVPVADAPVSTAVPLGPWVPLGSGLGIILLTLMRLRRGARDHS